jgi:hypothetical protein
MTKLEAVKKIEKIESDIEKHRKIMKVELEIRELEHQKDNLINSLVETKQEINKKYIEYNELTERIIA